MEPLFRRLMLRFLTYTPFRAPKVIGNKWDAYLEKLASNVPEGYELFVLNLNSLPTVLV